jgi:hypothetical protein
MDPDLIGSIVILASLLLGMLVSSVKGYMVKRRILIHRFRYTRLER